MADEVTEEQTEAKRGTPWLLVLLVAVLGIGAGVGLTVFVLPRPAAPAEADAGAAAEGEEVVQASFAERNITLDPFVVNVGGEGYPRYLKLEVAFELDSAEAKSELEEQVPKIRDQTILLLSSKRLSEITDFEGKALLKEDLRDRVDGLLEKGRVESVMFTEFVVQ